MKAPKFFLDKQALRDELDEFRREWSKERKEFGHFVPAYRLFNTGIVLRELSERGLIDADGAGGFAPH